MKKAMQNLKSLIFITLFAIVVEESTTFCMAPI